MHVCSKALLIGIPESDIVEMHLPAHLCNNIWHSNLCVIRSNAHAHMHMYILEARVHIHTTRMYYTYAVCRERRTCIDSIGLRLIKP